MKKLIVTLSLGLTLLVGAKAKAQTYYSNTLASAVLIGNAATIAFVNTTYNTNTATSPTNIFQIRPGQPVTIKVTQQATNATTANVTYTLKTTTDAFITPTTKWDSVNKIVFSFALASTTEVIGCTNLAYSLFGGAKWGILASMVNAHTSNITAGAEKGSY
jgi:hypothetical protein